MSVIVCRTNSVSGPFRATETFLNTKLALLQAWPHFINLVNFDSSFRSWEGVREVSKGEFFFLFFSLIHPELIHSVPTSHLRIKGKVENAG